MADPFSIATGIIGLAETGTALASFLTDKYRAYRDAPEQILEIAHEVEFCAGLISVFEDGVERRAAAASAEGGGGEEMFKAGGRFERDAGNLVRRTQKLFREIRALIPKDTNSLSDNYRARWRYMVDKKKLTEKQQRLRELQQMFMFMETMYRYNADSRPTSNSQTGGSKGPGLSIAGGGGGGLPSNIVMPDQQGGSFEGVVSSSQQQQQANGSSAESTAVQFLATLTLRPMPTPGAQQAQTFSETIDIQPRMGRSTASFSSEEKKRKDEKRERQRLENLRRSPYFRPELLEPEIETRMAASMPATYSSEGYADDYDQDEEDGILKPVPATTTYEFIDFVPESRAGPWPTHDAIPESRPGQWRRNDAEVEGGGGDEGRRGRRDVCSKDEARRDVEDWFDRWFKDDNDNETNRDPPPEQARSIPSSPPRPHSSSSTSSASTLAVIPAENAYPSDPSPPRFPWETDFPQPRNYNIRETQPGAENYPQRATQAYSTTYDNAQPSSGSLNPPPPQPRSKNLHPRFARPDSSISSSSTPSTSASRTRRDKRQRPHLTWQCNACHQPQLNGSKFHCGHCQQGAGYEVCRSCYYLDDGDWGHVHPRRCFTEMVPASSTRS